MHHLRFTDDHPGYVYVKDSVDSPERIIKLVQDEKWKLKPHNLLPVIPPPVCLLSDSSIYTGLLSRGLSGHCMS